jgi:subtilase family serine protease
LGIRIVLRKTLCSLVLSCFGTALVASALGQAVVRDRITQQVTSASTFTLKGSASPLARAQYDAGRVNASAPIAGVTMYFKPSADQQAALDALVQAQQMPRSPYYHQWITPAQYAARFGMSANDIAKVSSWLEQQGFAVDRVSNSRNAISFSGTAAQIEAAFQTELHRYNINGVTHTANATPFVLPSALAGVVLSVGNVSDFRPHPLHRVQPAAQVSGKYDFSSGSNTYHFLAPSDFATIYDVNAAYNAGYTGSGITIVVVGQTAIASTDVTHFQSASGLTQKAPTMTLVTGSGTSVADDTSGDEDESDLDVEWSGAVAKGATINFVYTGNNQNYNVFDSIQFAIDSDLGTIISNSYGACEADVGSNDAATFQTWFEQANAQGQTIVSASGDNGATDCESTSSPSTVVGGDEATQGLAVDFPASSPYVTGIGGNEFSGDVSSPSTYWNSTNSSSNGSVIQYISEEVWNDTSTSNGPEGGGGGKSILFSKPSWQAGTGVPADGARDVPDVSLAASPNHDGYLFCATGTGNTNSDTTSCSNGYLDSKGDPSVAGGTSFGAPTFSGILAILSQKLGAAGLGNINPEIYSLAATDYSTVFHDVTTGNNNVPCEIGSTDCTTSPIGYSATTGYDLASGWGSIDVANFVDAYTTSSTSAPVATTTSVSSSPTSPVTVNTAITLTATVAANSGNTNPAGSILFTITTGTTAVATSTQTLANGSATYSFTPTAAGTYTVVAAYTPSDATVNSASSGTLNIIVNAATTVTESFTVSATGVTVAQGSSGASTVTVVNPVGVAGSVALTATAPASLTNSCFTYTNPTASATGTITIYTSSSACVSTAVKRFNVAANDPTDKGGPNYPIRTRAFAGTALLSLIFLGIPGIRRRRWAAFCAILSFAALTVAVSGCGSSGSSSTSTSTNAAKGTYTITVTGTNGTPSVSANTTFTLTVD